MYELRRKQSDLVFIETRGCGFSA